MGVRRADEAGVQQARQLDVVDKAPATGKERRIFEALDARTEEMFAPIVQLPKPCASVARRHAAATMP